MHSAVYRATSDFWLSAAVGAAALPAGIPVNRKAVYRVLRLKGWLVHQRTVTPRARVQGLKSAAERRAVGHGSLPHVPYGADGWGHLTAVVQRWTAKRRAALVISVLRGETTTAEAARRHGLKVAEVEEWRERFLLGAENALRARPKEEDALREEEVNRLKRKVGELTMDLDILREAAKRPTTPGTSDE